MLLLNKLFLPQTRTAMKLAPFPNRPCFDRLNRLSHGRVLLDIDGPVDGLVPHGRLVGPVHHVDLDLHRSGER